MSQPPYDPNWQQPGQSGGWQPPQQPPQQPPYQPPQQPPYQPPQPAYEPPPYQPPQPTEQLPSYGQPAYGQPAYGQPAYGQPEQGGGYGGPPAGPPTWGTGGPGQPAGGGGGGGNGKLIAIIVVALLVVGGGIAAAVALTGGKSKPVSQSSSPVFPTPTKGSSSLSFPSISLPSFPSVSIPSVPSLPDTSATASAADQAKIAANSTAFFHALAATQPSVFCPLWDPTDLAKVLKQNNVSSCQNAILKSPATKTADAAFAVTDPTEITVDGTDAEIPADAITPANFNDGDPVVMKQTSGVWKVVFSA